MDKIKIPIIEETIAADAYEARMHFLYLGNHSTLPGMVSTPTAAASQAELPYRNHPGLLIWVNFAKPEIIDEAKDGRLLTISKEVKDKVGGIALGASIKRLAITTYPGELQPYIDIPQNDPAKLSFVRFWLARYAANMTFNSFSQRRNPLADIYNLYDVSGVKTGLRMALDSSKDPEEAVEAYIASLAEETQSVYPELFAEDNPWHSRVQDLLISADKAAAIAGSRPKISFSNFKEKIVEHPVKEDPFKDLRPWAASHVSLRADESGVMSDYIAPQAKPIVYTSVRPAGYRTQDAYTLGYQFPTAQQRDAFVATLSEPVPTVAQVSPNKEKWIYWDIVGLQSTDIGEENSVAIYIDAEADHDYIQERLTAIIDKL